MESRRHRRPSTLSSQCSSHSPVPEPEPEKTFRLTCSPVLPSGPSFLVCSAATSVFSLPSSHSEPWHWRSVRTCPIGGTPGGKGPHSKSPCPSCASALGTLKF